MRTRRSVRSAHALAGALLAAALAVTGCGAGGDSGDSADSKAAGGKGVAADERAPAEAAPGSADQGAPGGAADRSRSAVPSAPRVAAEHIIRTVSLSVQVKDTPKALDAARTATENAGGYVGDETTTRDTEGHEQTQVTLRVPVERYEEVLDDLEGAGSSCIATRPPRTSPTRWWTWTAG
ncbi:Lipoprotein OS=Streptomyces albaduncus OX=68172 GN=FHS32_001424 PE=4 SV=1 [Streptomyces griseoloalbus]